jgi:putative transposase
MSSKSKYLQSVGEYFHIYNRGVNRGAIFFEKRNYDFFVKRMTEFFPASGISFVAYCLMPNHYHFLLRQDEPNLISEYIGSVCKSYVQAINVEKKRSGHLFEGKYKIKHVNKFSYLLHLSRYIHLNPVTAGLVQRLEKWEYSSFLNYCGLRENGIVDTGIILQEFKKRENYIKFIQDYNPPPKDLFQYLFDE